MAKLVKQPTPPGLPPGRSFWHLELSPADVQQIAAGGAAVLEVVLPISDPEAELTILQVPTPAPAAPA